MSRRLARRSSDPVGDPSSVDRRSSSGVSIGQRLTSAPSRLVLFALVIVACLSVFTTLPQRTGRAVSAAGRAFYADPSSPNTTGKRRRQVIKAGGVPKEGFGSSIGFMRPAANIAYLLDADYIISQTATFFDYKASEYLNKGIELQGGGKVCDILEILELDPGSGNFMERMDRSLGRLDQLYYEAREKCINGDDRQIFSDYALKELETCDVIIINDHRIRGGGWTPCNQAWWKSVIDKYSGPAHGNDIAIHFRWGDMYHKAQTERKWINDMTKVAPLVNIIREENPTVKVRVYMARSENNETDAQLREILKPLDGDFEIVEAGDDIEELSMMAKARYLFINAGSFSSAAAATRAAQVIVHNDGGGGGTLQEIKPNKYFSYHDVNLAEFRAAVKP